MQFDVGTRCARLHSQRNVAQESRFTVACGSKRETVVVAQRFNGSEIVQPRKHAAPEAPKRKAASLFAGPGHGFEGAFGLDPIGIERAQGPERRDRAVRTVIRAAGRHGVEMRSGQDRRRGVSPRAHRKDVARSILRDVPAVRPRPRYELRTRGIVGRAEQTPVDTVLRRAEPGEESKIAGNRSRSLPHKKRSEGCVAIQWRAISTRRAIHTSSCSST